MTRKKLYIIAAIFYVVVLGTVTLPFATKLIDRVEPHILGLPCMQFFILASAFTMAIGHIIWFNWECRIEDRENVQNQNIERGMRSE